MHPFMELGLEISLQKYSDKIDQGGVLKANMYTDLRHLGRRRSVDRRPGFGRCHGFAGVDPILQPVPVQPAQHYSMEGLLQTSTARRFFRDFCSGECGCVSVHARTAWAGTLFSIRLSLGEELKEGAYQITEERRNTPKSILGRTRTASIEAPGNF